MCLVRAGDCQQARLRRGLKPLLRKTAPGAVPGAVKLYDSGRTSCESFTCEVIDVSELIPSDELYFTGADVEHNMSDDPR